MIFRIRNSNKLLVIGLCFLTLANVWHWSAQRAGYVSEGLTDGVFGLFMGIAIGTLLISIGIRRRSSCREESAS